MPNVLITERCNRRCHFCFARRHTRKMGDDMPGAADMTMDELVKIMDFAIRSGKKELRLLGGEPTTHPKFIDMVENALLNDFHVHLFTNGMMPGKTADYLCRIPPEKLSILCNVSPQSSDSSLLLKRREYAFEKIGDRIIPGITISSTEWEYEFILKLIKRFNFKNRIRIGIAQPVVGYDNAFLDPSDYHLIGRPIVEMALKCIEKDVLIGFDCGMTFCMFTESELGILATSSEGFQSRCSPIIDVGPGLNLWHCFPLSEIYKSHLDSFHTREAAHHYYTELLKPYKTLGCLPECLRCNFKRREQCTGGCVAHTINSLRHLPEKIFA